MDLNLIERIAHEAASREFVAMRVGMFERCRLWSCARGFSFYRTQRETTS